MTLAFEGENFSVGIVSKEIRSRMQKFEVVLRPQIVLCVPVTPSGNFVLVRQHRVAVNQVLLEFPAGRIEIGEQPDSTVMRELREEIGFEVTAIQRVGILYTAPHFSDECAAVYIARGSISCSPRPSPKEDLRDIIEITSRTLAEWIRSGKVCDGKSIAAYALVSDSDREVQ